MIKVATTVWRIQRDFVRHRRLYTEISELHLAMLLSNEAEMVTHISFEKFHPQDSFDVVLSWPSPECCYPAPVFIRR
jgi:hypothetical protein